jgi:hypothetical protein
VKKSEKKKKRGVANENRGISGMCAGSLARGMAYQRRASQRSKHFRGAASSRLAPRVWRSIGNDSRGFHRARARLRSFFAARHHARALIAALSARLRALRSCTRALPHSLPRLASMA